MAARNILVTGFVADEDGQGTIFPSAGGNSAKLSVQAVYWRCIAVFFASARINSPDLDLVLCSNIDPPRFDGQDFGKILDQLGVECRKVPLTHRLPQERTRSWGNVLYFLDIMDSLAGEHDETCVAILDSDVIVTQPVTGLWDLLKNADFAGYVLDTRMDEPINGMTLDQIGFAAAQFFGSEPVRARHYGGELLATRIASWNEYSARFTRLYQAAADGKGAFANATTEEHLYSVAFAGMRAHVAPANALLKRIWTSPRFSNVTAGDEALALWHLPAEKRYGLADLFRDLAARGFEQLPGPKSFRAMAMRRAGLPKKSAFKVVHDGMRQLSSKVRGKL